MCHSYNFLKGFLTKRSYKDFVGPLRKDGILDIACIHTRRSVAKCWLFSQARKWLSSPRNDVTISYGIIARIQSIEINEILYI